MMTMTRWLRSIRLTRRTRRTEKTKTPGDGVKRARYYNNRAKGTIATVKVPARCPEEDPKCTDSRTIKLFIQDRRQDWIALDDAEWAVKYLHVQNVLEGAPLIDPESAGPGGA